MDQLELDVPPSESRGALLSDDGMYRYNLWRRWGVGLLLGYVMLNPSIANATIDDQTIKRCCYFARREGFDGIYVVNLYAFRATKPDDLWCAGTAMRGPENDHHLVAAAANDRIGEIVAAWGALPDFAHHRSTEVRRLFQDAGRDLHCLGLTAKGWPRHPSRLPNAAPFHELPATRRLHG